MRTLSFVCALVVLVATPALAQSEFLVRGQRGLGASLAFARAGEAAGPGVALAYAPSDRLSFQLALSSQYSRVEAGPNVNGSDDRLRSISPSVGVYLARQDAAQPLNVGLALGFQLTSLDRIYDHYRRREYEHQAYAYTFVLSVGASRDLDTHPRRVVMPRVGIAYAPFVFVEGRLASEPVVVGSVGLDAGFPMTARSTLVVSPEVGIGSGGVGFAVGVGVVRAFGTAY